MDDDMEWKLLKPEIFATIMDFFSANLPVLNNVKPQESSGKESFYSCFLFLYILQ